MSQPPFDRAAAKKAGYSDEEIDAFLSSQGSARVSPKTPEAPKAAESWSTRGKALSAARAGAQGLTFGFGDEAEALASSLVSKKPYKEELSRIRGEMGEFSEAYPKTAFVAETAGGFASGGGMASLAAKRGGALASALAKSATVQGALSGAGGADGGVSERALGAGIGGVAGGLLGGIMGKVTGKAAERMSRGGAIAPGTKVLVDAMDAGRMSVDDVSTRARQMAKDAPESRVLDVLGEPGKRQARRIEALGGEAGQDIYSTMLNRKETRPLRYQDALTRTTGKSAENVVETIDDLVKRRKVSADEMYQQVYQQPPVVNPDVERLLENPAFKGPVDKAVYLMSVKERPVEMVTMPDGTMQPARTPEFLDTVKKAMDDVIYRGRQPGEGGYGPGELSALKEKRGEFVKALDSAIQGYDKARGAWAGETALKQALEDGIEFAQKKTDPRIVAKALSEMGDSEREMVQRGWLDGIRQRIDNDALTPKQLRTNAFKAQAQAVFGDDADNLINALGTELELNTNVNDVVFGSRTAPLQNDIAEGLPEGTIGKAVITGEEFRRHPIYTTARLADRALSSFTGPKAAQDRVQKAKTLITPASEIESVMVGVRRAAAARQIGKRAERVASPAIGRLTGRAIVQPTPEERNP